MQSVEFDSGNQNPRASRLNVCAAVVAAIACLGAAAPEASAATVSRSVVVQATPSAVWSIIGPFCAIKDWLPPVGSCSEDGGVPPIRTLVTRDGKATFVEQQTARSETQHFYSYIFLSSPLPLSHYSATIRVSAKGPGQSTVTWRGSYTPDTGKEAAAKDALEGIYAAGLDSIKSRMAGRFAAAAREGNAP